MYTNDSNNTPSHIPWYRESTPWALMWQQFLAISWWSQLKKYSIQIGKLNFKLESKCKCHERVFWAPSFLDMDNNAIMPFSPKWDFNWMGTCCSKPNSMCRSVFGSFYDSSLKALL